MPNPPQDNAQDSVQNPQQDQAIQKAMPTGAQVHDALMSPIESELTTESLKTLDAKYVDETPEERVTRAQRYKLALDKYDIAFSAWVNGVNMKVSAYKQSVLTHAEKKSGEKDAGEIDDLESKITDFIE